MKKIFKRTAALLLCAAMLVCMAACGKDKEKDKEPDETGGAEIAIEPGSGVAIRSEHYDVTLDMFAYYFYKDYYDAVSLYYDTYYGPMGLDPNKDLKEQQYSDGGSSWFDFFVTICFQNTANYLFFAEAALDAGDTVTDEIKARVDAEYAQLESAAAESGESVEDFIEFRFGKNVTEEIIRRSLELYYFATDKYDRDLAKFEYTDEDLEKYCEENLNSFLYIDYRIVEVRADQTKYESDEAREKGFAAAKEKAEYIASAENIDEYVERGVEYLTSINGAAETPLTDEEIFRKVTNIVVQYAYNDRTQLGKWAFADGRQPGDITLLDNGAGIYSVIYLVSAPYRLEYTTVNYRSMNFTDKAAAEEAFAAWESGEKTAESFADTALEYAGVSGVLHENVELGSTNPTVEGWIFADGRKPGDCEIVEGEGIWYILYFEGEGEIAWKAAALDKLKTSYINVLYTGYQDKYKVVYDLNTMNELSGETAYTRALVSD